MKLVPKRTAEAASTAAKSGDPGVLTRWKEGSERGDKDNTPPNGSQPPAAGNQQPAAGPQPPAAGNQQPGPGAQNPKPAQPGAAPGNTSTVVTIEMAVGGNASTLQIHYPPAGIIIGRGSAGTLRIDDKGVSRQHANLQIEGDRIFVTDLKSFNGVFHNGARIVPQKKIDITDNPEISLLSGKVIIKVVKIDRSPQAGRAAGVWQIPAVGALAQDQECDTPPRGTQNP